VKPEIAALERQMERQGYIADPAISTAVYLARQMRRPLLIEGEAGVGKTEIAKVWAALESTELVRLQCYEGLDVSTALYEWNYQRQLLRLRLEERSGTERRAAGEIEELIFGRDYLLERPLLRAITRREGPAVLLIDEVDRADPGFEAFLLEVLSDFQVTIPELGTIRAAHVPWVVLTSNRTREISDALRRRCLYLYLEHPGLEKEVRILRARVPEASARLATEVGRFVQALRRRRLTKAPGVAEAIDWTQALLHLERAELDLDTVERTLGCLLKDGQDLAELEPGELQALVAAAAEPEGAGR
jgi:MoxR-like ATPase